MTKLVPTELSNTQHVHQTTKKNSLTIQQFQNYTQLQQCC